ncbi:LytR/AlgR family response regulator transcription factor [Brevundimonas sp.]|uniref:LytR/AlgR family response regulator transcription factor n=1 Tax=Brevundimonas sp. TaxID=1871086 RepID=UPI003F72B303
MTRYSDAMWRFLLLTVLLLVLPGESRAQAPAGDPVVWEACTGRPGAAGPVLGDCRPVGKAIDPQGREIWLRGVVARPDDDQARALYVVGTAASEVWLNGRRFGSNGQPGGSAARERPGRYQIALPIPERAWRDGENVLVVRMSSFHGGLKLSRPVMGLFVAAYPLPATPMAFLAVVFAVAGALFAAAFGFGVIHMLRRTTSSLILAAIAGVASAQAVLESLRHLTAYAYPLHVWRLVGIWGLAAAFSILLVSWVVLRFWPGRRPAVIGGAAVLIVATGLAPGFDLKTGLALLVGAALSLVAAGVGAWRRTPTARLTLAYLAVFLVVAVSFPEWLVDLSYFLLAAALVLPLLMVEVVRLGRDDREREAALSRAAARPNCLTVASARGVERAPLKEIVAVVGADDYVELRMTGGRTLLHAARLDRLEAELPPSFMRVHRSVIANLDHVRGMEREGGRWRLILTEGAPLPVSRARAQAVRDRLDEPLGET